MNKTEFEKKVSAYIQKRVEPTEGQKLIYLGEVHGLCPLCGTALMSNGLRNVNKLFEIAHIFPCKPTSDDMKQLDGVELYGDNSESMHNKIALCKNCHYDYDHNKNKECYNNLLNIKKNLEGEYSVKNELAECNLEKELSDVLLRLKNIKSDDLEGLTLSFDAVKVTQKIGDSCLILQNKVQNNVVLYFRFIQGCLKDLCEASNTDFELVAGNVRTVYLKCKRKGMNQEKIFTAMSNWIVSKTLCSQTAAEIIVSFFVQDCEVYDKLS